MQAVEASLTAAARPTTSISTRPTGTIATRRSTRRCAPSTTSCARARCATSALRTTRRGGSRARSGRASRGGYVRYECLQPKYNLVIRDEYERELEPLCLEQDVGVIPVLLARPAASSSGKYQRGGATCPRPRARPACRRRYMNDRGFAVIAAVEKVAARRRRHAGAGRAVVAGPSARDHGADRQRDVGGAAQRRSSAASS